MESVRLPKLRAKRQSTQRKTLGRDNPRSAERLQTNISEARLITTLVAASLASLSGCTAVDGDTLNCNGERIRLFGIDAPEFHCPRYRKCVPGDPQAAKDFLAALITVGELSIERVGIDRYGRALGVVYVDNANVSCVMIQAGYAQYIERWDNGGRVARDC